jgi:hypothetical protein
VPDWTATALWDVEASRTSGALEQPNPSAPLKSAPSASFVSDVFDMGSSF